MANEGRVRAEIAGTRLPGGPLLGEVFFDQAGVNTLRHRQTIGTSEEALILGDASGGGGWFMAKNIGSNAVSLRVATGAANFCTMNAGEFCLFRWSTAATAPFAIATGSSSELEYALFEA